MTEINFKDIWNKAVAKGREEADSHKETMHVWQEGNGTKHIHGACGFSRVVLNDGRSSFAKWAKKMPTLATAIMVYSFMYQTTDSLMN